MKHYSLYFKLTLLFLMLGVKASSQIDTAQDAEVKQILREAFEHIAVNHPNTTTRYYTLYSEFETSADESFFSSFEGTLIVDQFYGDKYNGKEQLSKPEVIRQTIKDSVDGKPVKIFESYAIKATPRSLDFVYQRTPFINSTHSERYIYRLDSAINYNETECYAIQFIPIVRKEEEFMRGTLYISKKEKAYVGATFWYPRPNSAYTTRGRYTSDYKYGGTQAEVKYKKMSDNRWHLFSLEYTTDNIETERGTNVIRTIQYKTLEIEQGNFRPLSNAMMLHGNEVKPHRKSIYKTSSSSQKLHYALHIGYNPQTMKGAEQIISLQLGEEKRLDAHTKGLSPWSAWMFGDELALRLTSRLSLSGRNSYGFSQRHTAFGTDILLNYSIPLTPSYDLWSMTIGAGYSFTTMAYRIARIDNPQPDGLMIHDKKFDTKQINLYTTNKRNGFTAQATLNYRITRKMGFFCTLSYTEPLNEFYRLKYKEASGSIFKRQSVRFRLNSPEISSENGTMPKIVSSKFYGAAGVRLYF